MVTFGPCSPWPVEWTCKIDTESPSATGMAVDYATYVLWALTGRQFGTCEVTLRPCRRECYEAPWPWSNWQQWPASGLYPQPALIGGLWFNIVCGSCSGGCSCGEVSEVRLPAPVSSITTVRVDGAPLVTGAYTVYDNRSLIRTDGGQWPRCNDLSKADTQPGTWSVTAVYGQEVPVAGQIAVGELACEMLRAIRGEDCRIPRNIARLVRQGVELEFPTVDAAFDKGRTGFYLVDLFVQAVNPHGLARRARTYSVDHPEPRRPS